MNPEHYFDLIALAGALLAIGGVSWIHPPSGLILAGLSILTVALLLARQRAGEQVRQQQHKTAEDQG